MAFAVSFYIFSHMLQKYAISIYGVVWCAVCMCGVYGCVCSVCVWVGCFVYVCMRVCMNISVCHSAHVEVSEHVGVSSLLSLLGTGNLIQVRRVDSRGLYP